MLHGIFLYGAFIHLEPASGWLVGYRDDSDDVVLAGEKLFQGRYGKLRSAHVYDACFLEDTHEPAFELPPSCLDRIRTEGGVI